MLFCHSVLYSIIVVALLTAVLSFFTAIACTDFSLATGHTCVASTSACMQGSKHVRRKQDCFRKNPRASNGSCSVHRAHFQNLEWDSREGGKFYTSRGGGRLKLLLRRVTLAACMCGAVIVLTTPGFVRNSCPNAIQSLLSRRWRISWVNNLMPL
jgi:hypothetical protein